VLNDEPPRLSLEDAEINCRVLVAAIEAIREKRLISLE
jgi:hypothetical protein